MIKKKHPTTIYKDNNIIRNKNIKTLSVHSLKILDFLYYHTQKSLNKKYGKVEDRKLILQKNHGIQVSQTTLKEWLGMEGELVYNDNGEVKRDKNNQPIRINQDKNYQQKIRDALKELSEPIDVYNFEEEGELYTWGLKHFLKNVKEGIGEDNKTKTYYIIVDKFLFNTIYNLKPGWTEIDLKYQKNWKSPNTLRLYQYLKSIIGIQKNIVLNIGWFNDFFKVKPYKEINKVRLFLQRHIDIINRDTDLKVEIIIDKKDKVFSFKIVNQKVKSDKQKTAIKKTMSESKMIENLMKNN